MDLAAFFTGQPLEILAAVRDLPKRSGGVVTTAALWADGSQHHDPKGPLSERIFGPLFAWECACGATCGVARDGERCPRCSVLCGSADLRHTTWGHVDPGLSLLHPRLVHLIAEILGWTEAEVRAVAHGFAYVGTDGRAEGHVSDLWGVVDSDHIDVTRAAALRPLLEAATGPRVDELIAHGFSAADLIVTVIPIPPPGVRGRSRSVHGRREHGVAETLWCRLVNLAVSAKRIFEIEAAPIVMMQQQFALQRAFEGICELMTGTPPSLWQSERKPVEVIAEPPAPWDTAEEPLKPTDPIHAVFAGNALLISYRGALARLSLTGSAKGVYRAGGRLVAATSTHAMFFRVNEAWSDNGPRYCRAVHVLDLKKGSWCSTLPDDCLGVVAEEDLEEVHLIDVRTGRTARLGELSDYPVVLTSSPDGKWIWAEDKNGAGGIFDAKTGLRHIDTEVPPRSSSQLWVAGARVRAAAESPVALHVGERDWSTLCRGVVRVNGEAVIAIEMPYLAAAFSADGRRLALVAKEHVDILSVAEPSVRVRRDLRAVLPRVRVVSAQHR